MTDDLKKRLLEESSIFSPNPIETMRQIIRLYEKERKEAADCIEELEKALKKIASWPDYLLPISSWHEHQKIVRDTVGEKKEGDLQ